MITQEAYLKSLDRLQKKEELKNIAIQNGNKFLEDYNQSLLKAKTENKHIFLLFYMLGCDGCNIIKYIIENNAEVKEQLDKYIILMYGVSDTQTSLIQKYNIYSYPTCMIIDSSEKIIKQKTGCKVEGGPDKNFLNWLKS